MPVISSGEILRYLTKTLIIYLLFNASMRKRIEAVLIGVILTKMIYTVPGVQVIAGLIGGIAAAYYFNSGPWEGVKTGFLKGLTIFLPAILLAGVLASVLSGVPIIGEFLGGSVILFAVIITIYTTIKAVIGGFIGGYVAQELREQ